MTKKFTHLRECYNSKRRWEKEVREFKKKYPNYCRRCGGIGGFIYHYDPSPKGIALAPGYMEDFDTCPECIEKDKCPRCGGDIIPTIGKYFDIFECAICGWGDLEPEEGVPQEPECYCDEIRMFRKEKKHAKN